MPQNSNARDLSQELNASPASWQRAARILAACVAVYRRSVGRIPGSEFDECLAYAADVGPVSAQTVLEEALNAVAEESARPLDREGSGGPYDPAATRRRHGRIEVAAPARVSDIEGKSVRPALVRDISWSGAAIHCPKLTATLGDRIRVYLPVGGGRQITVLATIVWADGLESPQEFGVEFRSLTPADNDRLLEVLSGLSANSAAVPGAPKVQYIPRIEIEYGDGTELLTALHGLTERGTTLELPEPLALGQSLLLHLGSGDADVAVGLRARVVSRKRLDTMGVEMYRISFRFEHPQRQLAERVQTAIVALQQRLGIDGGAVPASEIR